MAIPRQIIRTRAISPRILFEDEKSLEIKVKKILSVYFGVSQLEQIQLIDSSRNSFYWVLSQLKGFVKKKKIILAGYNFSLMRDIVIKAGFEPVYADVSLKDFNISLDAIKKVIGKDVGIAIIPHLFGIVLREEIFEELKKHDIFIIEDCAHTYPLLCSKAKSISREDINDLNDSIDSIKPYNTGTKGDIAIYSFNFSKQVSATYGGLIVLNNLNNPKFKVFRKIFFELENTLGSKEFLKELKIYFKSVISSLVFCKPVFNMIVFPIILFENKKGKKEDFIDRLSKDPITFTPQPIKRMGKLGLMHLLSSFKGFFNRYEKIIKLQNIYDCFINLDSQNQELTFIEKSNRCCSYREENIRVDNKEEHRNKEDNNREYISEEENNIEYRCSEESNKNETIKSNICRNKIAQFLYPIVVRDLKKAKKQLLKKGIDVKKDYCVDISNGVCKNARFLQSHVLYIPFHEKISKKEANLIKSEIIKLTIKNV